MAAVNTPLSVVDRCKQLEEGDDSLTSLRLTITNYSSALPTLTALKNSTHLREIQISSSIGDDDIAQLCRDVLLKNISLESVTLDLCECSNQGTRYLAEVIEKTCNIKTLSLIMNGVDQLGASYLAEALKLSSLSGFSIYATQLDLLDYSVGDNGAGYLAAALKFNNGLSSLCISQSHITNVGLESILASLQSNGMVNSLNLHSNLIDKDGASALGDFLTSNATLKHLVLDKNHNIGCEGAKDIALALCKNHTLKILSLRSCGIGRKGGERFATALSKNSTLEELDLCGNLAIGDSAVELISRGLKENRGLCKLNMSSCGVGDEGCAHLADALLTNNTLTHLWLHKNHIGDGGALALSDTLAKTSVLTCLVVTKNRFSDQGTKALLECLKINPSLTTLQLDGTTLLGGQVSMATALLAKNKQLRHYMKLNSKLTQKNEELEKEIESYRKQLAERH